MDKKFRERVIDALLHDEPLPPDWARILFPPEKREAELVYDVKEREEEILANTMSVPLQPVSTFGRNGIDWHNRLIFGDNLQAMKTLLHMKEAGELCNADGTPGVRLVYIDPPFATKREFSGSKNQGAYHDKIVGAEFLEFLRKRLVILRQLLAANGTIYVHLDSRKGHYVKALLDEIFSGFEFAEIAWICGLMGSGKYYPKAHENIYCYKAPGAPFYPPQRIGLSPRITKALQKDKKGWFYTRGKESSGGSSYLKSYVSLNARLTKEEAIEDANRNKPQQAWSVWMGKKELAYEFNDFPVGTYAYTKQESVDYPTQKPEALLERIISASSREGDLVLDAFAGSGTTCAVAEKLKRRWVAIDCGKLAIYTIQKRMLNLRTNIGNTGALLKPVAFTVYNAGLYDFTTLRKLPWPEWRFFALQLFGCKDEPHEIGGLALDGKLKGSSVLVFNHQALPGKRIDEDTVRDIHLAIGKQIGKQFFIIAPRGIFDFQQDYLDLDGIRYYALRIPYSIINELHTRSFSALEQPRDEAAINATVDAVGFDFIRPPRVRWLARARKAKGTDTREAVLHIRSFASATRVHGLDLVGGLETFAMLMLDLDYDGNVFELDKFYLATDLQRRSWEATIPAASIGKQVMAVFIDIYGNESREVIAPEKFGLLSAGPARFVRRRSQHAA